MVSNVTEFRLNFNGFSKIRDPIVHTKVLYTDSVTPHSARAAYTHKTAVATEQTPPENVSTRGDDDTASRMQRRTFDGRLILIELKAESTSAKRIET